MKMKGSVLLALAETKEELLENLKEDIYVKSGVWDLEKVGLHAGARSFRFLRRDADSVYVFQAQIYPFKSALRKPLEVNM